MFKHKWDTSCRLADALVVAANGHALDSFGTCCRLPETSDSPTQGNQAGDRRVACGCKPVIPQTWTASEKRIRWAFDTGPKAGKKILPIRYWDIYSHFGDVADRFTFASRMTLVSS